MSRRIAALLSGLTLLLALGGAGAWAGSDRGRPLVVIFEDRQQQDVDTGAPGATPGDYYVFAQRLESPGGSTVGNIYGRCTTHFDAMETCEGYVRIDGRGLIAVGTAFPADFSEPVTLAVNGGTGSYQKVRGEGRFTQFPDGRFGVIFHLRP